MILSEKSKAIVERFKVHRDRCRTIEKRLGKLAALAYHGQWKSDPGNPEAKKSYDRLLVEANN